MWKVTGDTLGVRTVGSRRVGRGLLLVTLAVMCVFIAVFTLGRVVSIPDAKALMDIGAEANIPTWWNTMLLALVAALAAIAWRAESDRGPRTAWAAVTAAGTYLSIDEAAVLHEKLGVPMREAGLDVVTYAWVLPGAAFAILATLVLVRLGRRLPRPTGGRLGLALVVYGGAAVGIEGVNGVMSRNGHGLDFTVGIILEEGLEMGACIIAVCAILDHLLSGDHGPSLERLGRPKAA
ncbi:hypothetical protein V6K52_17765 [Knoellia sp. S7-12]|uniref:hypothetical protein n=1 Tax=Knoellia sp. S7-12 TaxID=3126698 RepID=UPI00336687AD